MEKKKKRLIQLEALSKEKDFWKDQERAVEINEEISELEKIVKFFNDIKGDLGTLYELYKTGKQEEKEEINKILEEIEQKIEKEKIKFILSGKYDKRNAIMTIYAGAGGIDAQDWAEMLLRMYLKYAQKKGFKAKVIQITSGEEAGIKNATLEIKGPYAYGYLKNEGGVHRLVRLSPFNADNLRHTSFAMVEVLPEFKETSEIKLNPEDLKIDTYRASGPGGQYVNKTESAVRITHIPTGITVACQSERLQGENKKKAIKLLQIKLFQRKLQEQKEEQEKLRGDKKTADWGNQIRSYVLHPYKLVKDHRTKIETSKADEVLDGELDVFIEAEFCLKNS